MLSSIKRAKREPVEPNGRAYCLPRLPSCGQVRKGELEKGGIKRRRQDPLSWSVGRFYLPLSSRLKGEPTLAVLQRLNETQWQPYEWIRQVQWGRVQEVVGEAIADIPYYRQKLGLRIGRYRPDALTYADFAALPMLEKEALRTHLPDILHPGYFGRRVTGRTSGSTGRSLTLKYSPRHQGYAHAVRWRAKQWWGIQPGDRHAIFWGRPYTCTRDRLVQKVKSMWMHQMHFSAFEMHAAGLDRIWHMLRWFRPSILYGYPSAIYLLALHLRGHRLNARRLGVKVIFITAEISLAEQRAVIEDTFGCPTANEYGCSETSGFVFECPMGNWHIAAEMVFVEFLDDRGDPVPEGEWGQVVVTTLQNDLMPLIRYRVGDIGRALPGTCACGRGLPLMDVSVGKERDFILTPDGKRHTSEILVYMTRAINQRLPDAILHFRAVQHRIDALEIEIVASPEKSAAAQSMLRSLLERQLGSQLQVDIRIVKKIERESSGKLRYFISHCNKDV